MSSGILKPNEVADIALNISNFRGIEDKIQYDDKGKATRLVIIKKQFSSLLEDELKAIEKYNLKLVSFFYCGECWLTFRRFSYLDREIDP